MTAATRPAAPNELHGRALQAEKKFGKPVIRIWSCAMSSPVSRLVTILLWLAVVAGATCFTWGYTYAQSNSFRATTIIDYQRKIIGLYQAAASPSEIQSVQRDLSRFQARMPLPASQRWGLFRLIVGFWVCVWSALIIGRRQTKASGYGETDRAALAATLSQTTHG